MARDVIVVGAGPVGLMLAGELRLCGGDDLDVVVYERLPEPSRESRGASFTRRTAECFDQRGLLGRLGGTERADSHFGGIPIDLGLFEEDHFSARGVPQYRTERMLEEWVTELGVPVVRGREVTGFRETDDGVVVTFEGPGGAGEERAAYAVGCDGGRSTLRELAGIGFPGAEPTRGFLTADVLGIEPRRRRIGEDLPGGSMVMAMDLEGGITRVVVHERGMGPRERDALTYAELADAWHRLTGESIHHGECRWMSCFTDASRVADAYRSGRVLLAGDATHVQPPAMAQGLSVGVQDVVNLGWKLAAVVAGRAPESLLDTYEAERRPVGRELARNARAAIELRLTGEEMDPVRGVFGELAGHKGAAGHLAAMLSGLGIRYEVGEGDHPLLGVRMPPGVEVVRAGGSRARIAELLRSGRGLLLATGDGSDGAARLAEDWDPRVESVRGTWAPGAGAIPGARELPRTVLVRPDGYVAWTSPGSAAGLADALGHWFGAPRTDAPRTDAPRTDAPPVGGAGQPAARPAG